MGEVRARITEDKGYKPSSPEAAFKRFFIETDDYRWVAHVRRSTVRETGTVVYCARSEEGHTAYGLTVNETLNDLASIMLLRLAACGDNDNTVSLDDVRSYLDPEDAAREDLKAALARSRKPLLARLLGL